MPFPIHNPERIEAFRTQRGLTVAAMAAQLGLSPTTLNKAKRGDPVESKSIRKIARYMNLTMTSLMFPSSETQQDKRLPIVLVHCPVCQTTREVLPKDLLTQFVDVLSTLLRTHEEVRDTVQWYLQKTWSISE